MHIPGSETSCQNRASSRKSAQSIKRQGVKGWQRCEIRSGLRAECGTVEELHTPPAGTGAGAHFMRRVNPRGDGPAVRFAQLWQVGVSEGVAWRDPESGGG